MQAHEIDFRNIFKQLKDIDSRLTYIEDTLKDIKKGKTSNEDQWRESIEESKTVDVEE